MKNRVLLKSALLLLLIGADLLVAASENDDLVFDQDGKQSSVEIPLIEKHEEQSVFQRIKRSFLESFFNPFNLVSSTTTTTPSSIDPEEFQEILPNGDNLNGSNISDAKKNNPSLERLTRDSQEENGDNKGENAIGEVAEGRRAQQNYVSSDDEDFVGSGEVEGSATDADVHQPVTESHKSEGKAEFYRITLPVGEPYRREYADRNSREYKELSGNLTQILEELYARHIADYHHMANVVKISPMSDAFTSQVTVDLGSTFPDELELRDILEQHLSRYHSLGSIQVSPEGFTFRKLQGKASVFPECDQSTELTCRNGACVPLDSRCDGTPQCDDGSDELDCHPASTQQPTTTRCKFGEFACDVRRCILESQRCDFVEDCQDGSDEHNCNYPACTSSQFKCRNGECIDKSKHCDGVSDCRDKSDEYGCLTTCSSDQFRCIDGMCLSIDKRCNGVPDCRNGEDENQCGCGDAEFRCTDGQCISYELVCNGVSECPDGLDERECECPVGKRACDNGVCIDEKFFCDKNYDCLDESDERDCPDGSETGGHYPEVCRDDEFTCEDGTCLPRYVVCDGRADCPQGTDEHNCPHGCGQDQFQCRTGDCIRIDQKCDGRIDCDDGSDEPAECEEITNEPETKECLDNEFQCASDKRCIPIHFVCNAILECSDGSDEENCDYIEECAPGEWKCKTGGCIYQHQRCNEQIDCPFDESDEVDCNNVTTERNDSRCRTDEWRCENGQCISMSQRCDKRIDCPTDMSDELDCSYDDHHATGTSGLNLKTYPTEQVIKENPAKQGREVVFQCRDEGPLRAKVRWLRDNDLPLPSGSRDINGRLEIPNIQLEHAGTYICEAVGYPPSTPGSRIKVHLTVEKFEEPATRPPQVCQYDQATCSNGDCIPKSYVCDGKFDCTDGSDEMRCNPHGCEPNEFRCNNKQCVSKLWRCDGDKDCADGSDEENCAPAPPGSPCRYSEFACTSRDQCIPKTYHCDRERDCHDGSDELGCCEFTIILYHR